MRERESPSIVVYTSCRWGVACSPRPSPARALLGEDGDHVVALGRSHSLARVLLTINLVLHKEMSLLFQVDVAVCAGVALGVTELVPQFHHHPPKSRETPQSALITIINQQSRSPTPNHFIMTMMKQEFDLH